MSRICILARFLRDPCDLDVHLEAGHAVARTGYLEVHVSEVILESQDIGEDRVIAVLHDHAHSDTRYGLLDRYARIHKSKRARTDTGHTARTVRFKYIGDQPDRIGKIIF